MQWLAGIHHREWSADGFDRGAVTSTTVRMLLAVSRNDDA